MSTFLFLLGVLCGVYYLIIVLYAGITADFGWFWLAAGALLSAAGALVKYDSRHPGFLPGQLKIAAAAAALAGILVFSLQCAGVLRGMTWKGSPKLDYVVVLGAQVKGTAPSRALKKRLVKALEYAEQNPETLLILSGGQGSGENITEARCMSNFLTEKGVSGERLILEEESTTTRENLLFSDKLTSCAEKNTGILSNNFHIYRAVKIAKKLGYTHPEGIAAPSDAVMQAHYVVREVFALVKEMVVLWFYHVYKSENGSGL